MPSKELLGSSEEKTHPGRLLSTWIFHHQACLNTAWHHKYASLDLACPPILYNTCSTQTLSTSTPAPRGWSYFFSVTENYVNRQLPVAKAKKLCSSMPTHDEPPPNSRSLPMRNKDSTVSIIPAFFSSASRDTKWKVDSIYLNPSPDVTLSLLIRAKFL